MYLIKYKSESFKRFREFKNEVEKQYEKNIKTLRSDHRVNNRIPNESSVYTITQCCIRKKESYHIRHGTVHGKFYELTDVIIGICIAYYYTYSKYSTIQVRLENTI